MTGNPFVSEAPVVCEVVRRDGSGWVLERRLDPVFAHLAEARSAFLAEVEAARAQRDGGAALAVVHEATGDPELRLVREYRPEGTLRDVVVAGGPVPVAAVLGIVSGIADALDELHRLGVVHGDPAPENVLLRDGGVVALADARSSRRAFARATDGAGPEDSPHRDWEALLSLTRRLFGAADPAEPSALRREALAILDGPREAERKLAALQRLGSSPLDVASLAVRRARPAIPFPVPVTIAVGAVTDPRSRYAVAKLCATVTGLTPGRASAMLEAGTLNLESVFPSPARALAADLAAAGAKVSIRAAGQAPAPIRNREV